MAEVKWIKITTDIFDDEKILLIESLPDAYAIITVWFKLLCLAGKQNNSGVFLLGRMPYTDKMLATIFRMKESTVTMALQTFESFGMIEIVDGVITIPNWGKHQSLDQLESKKEYMRKYMKGYREKQKSLTSGKTNCKTNSKANVSQAEEDKEKEIDIDIEEEKKENIKEKDVADLFNSLCPSFPAVQVVSDEMKSNIQDSFKKYGLDGFKTVFSKAEASDFLKGSQGWKASFDWLIQAENMAKVLNGNYDKVKSEIEKIYEEWEKENFARRLAESPQMIDDDPELKAEAEALKKELALKY